MLLQKNNYVRLHNTTWFLSDFIYQPNLLSFILYVLYTVLCKRLRLVQRNAVK